MLMVNIESVYARLDDNFVLFCRRPNIRQFNRFMTIIRFLLEVGLLSRVEYEFLVDSVGAVYES